MGGDPIPGHHDILRLWYKLRTLKGKERAEAVAKLEEWLRKRGPRARRKPERGREKGDGEAGTEVNGDATYP